VVGLLLHLLAIKLFCGGVFVAAFKSSGAIFELAVTIVLVYLKKKIAEMMPYYQNSTYLPGAMAEV